jgi:phosphate transport system permease protein
MTTTSLPTPTRAQPRATAPSRKAIGKPQLSDVLSLAGAAAAALAFTFLVFAQVTPLQGPLGALVVWYLAFLAGYAVLVSLSESLAVVRDRLAAVAVHTLALILLGCLAMTIGYTIFRGFKALIHLNFYVDDMEKAGPLDGLSAGGIRHAAIGTLEQISIALVITVPLGLSAAVFLSEVPGRFARFVRTVTEAMTALPSIVAGLFIYATFILALGFGKCGLAAALALSIMMLPIIIRAADVVLRLVPGNLKEASYALGAGRWQTVRSVVLPTSRSGLATAIILGTARGIGETSPVLLTAGYTAVTNASPARGPQVSLPLAAFQMVQAPQPAMIARGFGAAAALMLLVLGLFIVARLIGGRGPDHPSKRSQARRRAQSRRDVERFQARTPTPHVIDLRGAGS